MLKSWQYLLRVRTGLLVAALVAGLTATAAPSQGTVIPGTNALIATQTATGIFVVDPVAGTRSLMPGSTSADLNPAVAPSGLKVAFSNGDNLVIADWPTGANRTVVTAINAPSLFDWSPDSTKIAAKVGTAIAQIPASAGGAPVVLTGSASNDIEPTYSPDGQYVVTTTGFFLFRTNADNSGTRVQIPGSSNANRHPQVSPNGAVLYFDTVTSSGIQTLPFPGGGTATQLAGTANSDMYPAPSPDGSFVVVQAGASSTGLVRLNAAGGGRTAITGSVAGDQDPSWARTAAAPPPVVVNAAPVFSEASACGGAALLKLLGAGPAPVSASDTAGQVVTLTAAGLPSWAAFASTPGNPVTGNFAVSFSFTNFQALIDLLIAVISGSPSNVTITATDNGTPVASATCAKTLRVTLF